MAPTVVTIHDEARGRSLSTTVWVPGSGAGEPLIVFCHGMWGNPGKFTWLFGRWADAGYVVAAPAFPYTSDEAAPRHMNEQVANQPADVRFVLDDLLARGLGDEERVCVGGFSLGAETALAVGLHPRHADPRVRAVLAIAGGLAHPDFACDVLRPLPLLFVHGEEDRKNGRLEEALRVYEQALEPKEFVTIRGGRHGICQDDDPRPHVDRVAELTTAFWDSYVRG